MLGVTLDLRYVLFDDHIVSVIRVSRYHIRAMRHMRTLIDKETATSIAVSVICTRIDYCNSVLNGVTESNMDRPQLRSRWLALNTQHHYVP